MSHCGNDETGQNALFGRFLNNRRTCKYATKPHTLGLLGDSDLNAFKSKRSLNQAFSNEEVRPYTDKQGRVMEIHHADTG